MKEISNLPAKGDWVQEFVCLSKFQRMPWSVYDPLRDQINFGYKSFTGKVEEDKTVGEVLNLKDYDPLKPDAIRPYTIIRDSQKNWKPKDMNGPLDFMNMKRTSYQTVLYEPKGLSINSCTAIRPFDRSPIKLRKLNGNLKTGEELKIENDRRKKYKDDIRYLKIDPTRQIIVNTSFKVFRGPVSLNNTDVIGVQEDPVILSQTDLANGAMQLFAPALVTIHVFALWFLG